MPLEPPPTRVTKPFLDQVRASKCEAGALFNPLILSAVPTTYYLSEMYVDESGENEWSVSRVGSRKIPRAVYLFLQRSTGVTEDGGFVVDGEEFYLCPSDLSHEYAWNLTVQILDKAAFKSFRARVRSST